MIKNGLRIMLVSVVAVLAGCSRDGEKPAVKTGQAGKLLVYTTFYPTKYFTERIGGDLVDVICPVPEDEDPIFWIPDDATIQRYQQADLIILNGASFEKWVETVVLPISRIVDTAKPLAAEFVHYESATVHSHGSSGEHTHEGIDGHTWLDPLNAIVQAGEIKDALIRRLPDRADEITARYRALEADLLSLDRALRAYALAYDKKPFLASHPAYNYIARRYGWNVINLDLDPEEMPSDESFAEIKAKMAEHQIKYLVWESFPAAAIDTRLREELGLQNIEFSPCELISGAALEGGEDYLSVMRKNLENIAPIFRSVQ
jgi:zinc transport system substrate-binding protein